MNRRSLAAALFASAMLLAAACTSGPRPLAAKTSQTIVLDGAVKRTEVPSRLAEEITLQLPPVVHPGYSWRLVWHDSRALKQSSEVAAAEPGGAATVKFVTQAVVPRTLIRFVLVRDTREDQPLETHEVVVSVRAEAPPKQ